MEKLISIIIATYNVESTISYCLDSIISQKTDEVELLIIDGASKDKSLEILETYKQYIDVLLSEPDKGIYDAWNKGISKASGKWIMFLGADDRLLNGKLLSYIDFVKKHSTGHYDLITAQAEYLDLNGRLIKVIGENFIWNHYRKNMLIAHGATLHNRRLFEEIGPYDIHYRICADYEMLMRKGEKISSLFFPQPIFQFEIGGASFSIACQKESFLIRKKYHTVGPILNVLIFLRRSLGIYLKSKVYKTGD